MKMCVFWHRKHIPMFVEALSLRGRDVAQAIEHSAVKVWILLHGGCIFSLGYFPFQSVVPNWFIKDCRMCCPVCGKVHIKDPLLRIAKSSLYGDSGFPLKKCRNDHVLDVNSRWYKNQCALEASLNKTNLPFFSSRYVYTCLRTYMQ